MNGHARRRKTPRYWSLLFHWLTQAVKRPAAAKIAPLPTPAPGHIAITFGGHATALCRYADAAIACDPMVGNWVGMARRETAPGVAVKNLAAARVIVVSQASPDHLHRKTLAAIAKENGGDATVALPPGAASQVSGLGFRRVVELSPGTGFVDGGIEITAVAMSPGNGYVIRGDGPSVLFCGDGGYFSGFEKIGETFAPSIALLPIGGFVPGSFRRRHMSPPDALRAFEDLRSRLLIPIRHGTFALSYERIDAPAAWLAELVAEREIDMRVAMLACGETRIFSPRSLRADTAVDIDIDVAAAGETVAATDPDRETTADPEPDPATDSDPDRETAAEAETTARPSRQSKSPDPDRETASDPEPDPKPGADREAAPRHSRESKNTDPDIATGADIAAAARAAAERGSRS